MKNLILIMLLVLGTFFSSLAQKVPAADEIAKKNIEEMEKRLNLTPTQKGVIYNYVFDLAKEQLILYKKQQTGNFNENDETKFFKFNNETNKNIKALLKPEQIVEFNILTEERLNGVDPTKKKKKLKKGEAEEKVVGIEGLKSVGNN